MVLSNKSLARAVPARLTIRVLMEVASWVFAGRSETYWSRPTLKRVCIGQHGKLGMLRMLGMLSMQDAWPHCRRRAKRGWGKEASEMRHVHVVHAQSWGVRACTFLVIIITIIIITTTTSPHTYIADTDFITTYA